ncbi:glycosyltransferase family 25 protein [Alteromonas stellipolaris]|uniref:Glycosyl transferase family 25 domain-containing protein n=1 Tax=Alteromonas stellipolaris TaxID=233316 RepID=A0ABN4LUZ9_9ALTE|nr:hypothetical protein AVL57_00120 [Alteromonas stellipolaris]
MIDTNFCPKVYVINLEQYKERLNNCINRLNKQNLALERIPAVLGGELTELEKSANYSRTLNRTAYHYELSNGEIGCYLSHRKAWEKIAKGDEPYGIVLEDDIELIGDLNLAINTINNLSIDWQVIKLAAYQNRKRKIAHSCNIGNGFELVVHIKPMTGCAATAITKDAAIKLLKYSESFGRPVDVDIQHFWEREIYVYSLLPYPVAQDMSYQSTISGRKVKQEGHFWHRKCQQFKNYFVNKKAVNSQILELKNLDIID